MSRVTLSRYLIEQTRSQNTPADLRFLIEVVARACKEISHAVSKGALGNGMADFLACTRHHFDQEAQIGRGVLTTGLLDEVTAQGNAGHEGLREGR